MFQFDTAAIFKHIGGPVALRRALAEDGTTLPPPKATIGMWRHRNRIAAAWVASCVWAVLNRNQALTVQDLIREDPGDLFT